MTAWNIFKIFRASRLVALASFTKISVCRKIGHNSRLGGNEFGGVGYASGRREPENCFRLSSRHPLACELADIANPLAIATAAYLNSRQLRVIANGPLAHS
jgi:hypothetical protein